MEKSKRTFRGSYPAYALTYFFFYWSLGVFTSVLSMYLTGIGKSKAEMSFIMSASSLFGVVLIPIVGYINDKLRKPRLICTVMMACVAVFGILFALVRETMLLFLLNGCIMGFISSLSPVSERMATSTKYRYGTIRIWGTFGYAAAVQVACAMMEFTSPQLIFVSVSVSAVLAIVGFLGTDDISFTDTEAAKAAAGKQFSFLCAPMYILFVIIGFVFSGCSNLNMTYSPILLQELGMPTGAVGTVLFFSTIVELPVILFSYKFMDRFSGRTLMLLAFAIMVAQFLLYATAPNAFVAVVTMLVLRAIGSTLFGMILLKIVRGVVQVRSVSTALGVISATDAMSAILMQKPWRYSGGKHEYPHLVFCHGGPDDARHDPNAVPARAEHGKGVFVKISPQLREISDVKLRGIFRSRTRLCNLKRRARGRGSTGSRIFL
ncbi:MFS transporter [Hominenteromicrobium sp.]|uniref:MFS transporter n=2 Tax=Hominenteromicrobium sp. TaxID=3073581 RepID=UPI003AEF3DBD